jgi:hypothetical protein
MLILFCFSAFVNFTPLRTVVRHCFPIQLDKLMQSDLNKFYNFQIKFIALFNLGMQLVADVHDFGAPFSDFQSFSLLL